MSINRSKEGDSRMWAKWEKAGAVAIVEDSYLGADGLEVDATGKHFAGPAEGNTTLSVGRRVVNQGTDWSVSVPVVCAIAPGHDYQPGQIIKKFPKGTRSIKSVFPNR